MTTFPDLGGYRMVLVDDRAEITAMMTAIFSETGVELTVTSAIDVAARLIRSYPPNLVLVATSIRGEPFSVVEAAQHNGVPVMALDFGSIGPEVSDRLRRRYGIAVARDVDDPEGLCHAAKRAATRRRKALTVKTDGWLNERPSVP